MTRFIKKSMYLVILMSRFRPAMMHLVQSYDDRDNGTEGVVAMDSDSAVSVSVSTFQAVR